MIEIINKKKKFLSKVIKYDIIIRKKYHHPVQRRGRQMYLNTIFLNKFKCSKNKTARTESEMPEVFYSYNIRLLRFY